MYPAYVHAESRRSSCDVQVSLNVAHDDLDESVSARKLAEASARISAQQADNLRVQVRHL